MGPGQQTALLQVCGGASAQAALVEETMSPSRKTAGARTESHGTRAGSYLAKLAEDQANLLKAWELLAAKSAREPGIQNGCLKMAKWTARHEHEAARYARKHRND